MVPAYVLKIEATARAVSGRRPRAARAGAHRDLPVPGAATAMFVRGPRAYGLPALATDCGGLTHLDWAWTCGSRAAHSLGAWRMLAERNGPGDFLTWIANNFDASVTVGPRLDQAEWTADRHQGCARSTDARDSVKVGAQASSYRITAAVSSTAFIIDFGAARIVDA